jgi:hypothetical protein
MKAKKLKTFRFTENTVRLILAGLKTARRHLASEIKLYKTAGYPLQHEDAYRDFCRIASSLEWRLKQ